jgi:hypothetical protein
LPCWCSLSIPNCRRRTLPLALPYFALFLTNLFLWFSVWELRKHA